MWFCPSLEQNRRSSTSITPASGEEAQEKAIMAISGTCTFISDSEQVERALAFIDAYPQANEAQIEVRKILCGNNWKDNSLSEFITMDEVLKLWVLNKPLIIWSWHFSNWNIYPYQHVIYLLGFTWCWRAYDVPFVMWRPQGWLFALMCKCFTDLTRYFTYRKFKSGLYCKIVNNVGFAIVATAVRMDIPRMRIRIP